MDPSIPEVVATCLHTVLTGEPWQDFSFPKRPRYGTWVQRFRDNWRVDLEKTVLQQMLSALTAAYVVSGRISAESISLLAGTYTSEVEVAAALGFSSQEEGARQLKESIQEYTSSSPDQWPQILHTHIRPDLLPDKQLGARLSSVAHILGLQQRTMIGVLKWKTT